MIEAIGLTRRYGDNVAVRNLTFSVAPGEILGLLGPNGAGKTTTLRCLAGIMPPTAGQVRIAGHDLLGEPVAARRALAYVPDEPHLFEYLTAAEHLRFVSRLYGVDDADVRARVLLEALGLAGEADRLPGTLSRGMRQKLQMAMALLRRPRALVLDEPLTGLDPAGIRLFRELIVKEARAGAAVLLSSHLLQLVEALCDRILVLNAGEPVFHGELGEIAAARPELEGRGLEEVFLALTATGPSA